MDIIFQSKMNYLDRVDSPEKRELYNDFIPEPNAGKERLNTSLLGAELEVTPPLSKACPGGVLIPLIMKNVKHKRSRLQKINNVSRETKTQFTEVIVMFLSTTLRM